jgi:ABC-2 type transport system ATP-binding protein
MSDVITISGLRKVYPAAPKPVTAVDGVDLTVSRGEIFGLLGPNGAGKSTTVGVCTTRVRPTSGTITVSGVDVTAHPSLVKRSIGVVSQNNTLDRACSVWENIYTHCRFFNMSGRDAKHRTNEVLEQFRLGDRAKAMPWALSGGLAQRLMLARAVAHRPSILFLDEPTAGLDPQSRLALWDSIRELREGGVTILLTTHYMDEADQMCDRLAIIDHGKVLVVDSPEALKRKDAADTIIVLEVLGDQENLAAELKDMPGVVSVDARGEELRVKTTGSPEVISAVIAVGVQRGLVNVSVTKPSLETVFIDLTGRDLRE